MSDDMPLKTKMRLSEATLSLLLGTDALHDDPTSAKTFGSVHPAPLYMIRGSSTDTDTLTLPAKAGSLGEG